MNVVRKLIFHFIMESQLMTDVNEISFFRFKFIYQIQNLGQNEMGMMRFTLSKTIDDEKIQVLQLLLFLVINFTGIGNVSQIFKLKT